MAYATLAKIKEWLQIPSATTTFDTELNSLITEVERKIDAKLISMSVHPVTTQLSNELVDISSKWIAGVFRKRRADTSKTDNQDFEREAKAEFEVWVKLHFYTSITKV